MWYLKSPSLIAGVFLCLNKALYLLLIRLKVLWLARKTQPPIGQLAKTTNNKIKEKPKMKNTGQCPQWRSKNSIPKSFTLAPKHIDYLMHRQNKTGARSLSHAVREMIEAEMAVNAEWNEGCDHGNS